MPGTVIVDGKRVEISGEKNLLELVRNSGVDLPTFCYHSELSVYGACRMCLVEDNRGMLQSACSTAPTDGLDIKTNTPRVQRIRRMMLELLLADHDRDCTVCPRNGRCKLQDLCMRFGVDRVRFPARAEAKPIDDSSPSLIRDPNKCILCGDCVRMCGEVQGIGAIDFAYRGSSATVMSAFGKGLADVDCINCGQCIAICPTGALHVKSDTDKVWKALRDPSKTVVLQMAPAVRVAIGEEFGYAPGEITTGKAVAAIRRLGFAKVFDTSFTADLTTIEETSEFVGRLLKHENLPQFTSCCPGWVKLFEQSYPDRVNQLSSCRSPQAMFGSMAKRFYSKQLGVESDKMFVVSVMPCTAKKFEADRPELGQDGHQDVDVVLTTQEIAKMIREAGVMFRDLEEESFDAPFGFATGSGVLFGATGGVAISAVRQAHFQLTGQRLLDVDFKPVEGIPSAHGAAVKIGDLTIRVGVVSGLAATQKLMAMMDEGKIAFDIVEVMACPGGCAGGGGQPLPNETPQRLARIKGLHTADRRQQIRVAQDNPTITEIYRTWLGAPGSQVAHEALHTHYGPRRRIAGASMEVLAPVAPTVKGEAYVAPVDVSVCVGTNCYLKGSREILQRFTEEIQNRNLGSRVNLRAAFCLENCGKGPTVRVAGQQLSGVKATDVPVLLDAIEANKIMSVTAETAAK